MVGGLKAACHFFVVKNLPFVDIAVGALLFSYHVNVKKSLRESARV